MGRERERARALRERETPRTRKRARGVGVGWECGWGEGKELIEDLEAAVKKEEELGGKLVLAHIVV